MEEVLKILGGSAILVTAVAWLARSLISQLLSKDIEGHKNKLKAESDRELARLTADLQVTAARERTKFDLLHQRRAEVVAKVYALLARTHHAARHFARPMEWSTEPSKQEKFDTLAKVGNELGACFNENRIFFPETTCDQLDSLYRKILLTTQTMMDDLNSDDGRGTQSWSNAWKAVDQEVPPMLKRLETEFRAILGSTEDGTENA
jgi:hypothetical protein